MNEKEHIKKTILQFLNLCVNYSEGSINRKTKRLENLIGKDLDSANKELGKWKNYKQFTEYTIKEILSGDLDEWIDNLDNPEFNPTPSSEE
ncbi:MAG: hypothetical protein CMB48_07255 [Euryarchaeota archaeon]|nr:hypothetical protein [Euryarchaeota archaeon]